MSRLILAPGDPALVLALDEIASQVDDPVVSLQELDCSTKPSDVASALNLYELVVVGDLETHDDQIKVVVGVCVLAARVSSAWVRCDNAIATILVRVVRPPAETTAPPWWAGTFRMRMSVGRLSTTPSSSAPPDLQYAAASSPRHAAEFDPSFDPAARPPKTRATTDLPAAPAPDSFAATV